MGRDEERGLLVRRWEQSKDGLGQVVLISGEAGIGKSSLLEVLRAHVRDEGLTRIAFRCSPYHQHSALYPVMTYMERLFHFDRNDAPATKLDKLEQGLRTFGLPLHEMVPLFAALLSVPLDARHPALTLTPPQQKQQTFDALVTWLLEEADRHPVLVAWEDLHWADPSTLELLGMVIEQAPTAPMMHVLTFRPEFEPPWPMRSHMTPFTLNRLERPQVEAFIRHLVHGKALPPEVVAHIVTKTDGVPLYVEEFTKMFLASDLLHEEADHYVLTGPLTIMTIPETLQDSLMARLDQLNAAKEIIQLGAVLGREFPYEMLQAIAPQDETMVQAGLARLVETELLYQRGRPPRARYLFKHALIQEAAYQSLLKSTRQQVHHQVAQLLEVSFPETRETQPEILAHHHSEAGLPMQAAKYWHYAGRRAEERSAYHEAASYYDKALDALQQLPMSHDTREQALTIQLDLRNALLPLGDAARIFACLLDAQKLAESLGDEWRLGRVYAYLTRYFFGVADHERAVASGQRALTLAGRLEAFDLQVTTRLYLGVATHSLGDYGSAIAMLTQNVEALTGNRQYERFGLPYLPAVFCRAWLVWCLAERGEFAEGVSHCEEAMHIAEAVNQPWDLMVAHRSRGLLHFHKGEFDQAIPPLAHCLELCQRGNLSAWFPLTVSTLGAAYALAGRIAEALPLLEQGVEQRNAPAHYALRVAYVSKGYLLAGRLSEAIQNAKRALELARRQQEQGYEAWSLWFLGEITVQCDAADSEAAEAYYRQARTLADKLGMRPLRAHCHLGLGTLYAKAGQREQARTALSTAMGLYRTMDMTFWLSQVEHVLAQWP